MTEDIARPWVSVEDRLPNRRGDYLAYSQSTGCAWMVYDFNKKWISGDEYISNVTHWMPLPDPPNDNLTAPVEGEAEEVVAKARQVVQKLNNPQYASDRIEFLECRIEAADMLKSAINIIQRLQMESHYWQNCTDQALKIGGEHADKAEARCEEYRKALEKLSDPIMFDPIKYKVATHAYHREQVYEMSGFACDELKRIEKEPQ